jgi:hypothetical protein
MDKTRGRFVRLLAAICAVNAKLNTYTYRDLGLYLPRDQNYSLLPSHILLPLVITGDAILYSSLAKEGGD